MPCSAGGSTASLSIGELVVDWAEVHPYVPLGVFRPKNLADVVACVQAAESTQAEVHAIGSVFSLSRAPDTTAAGFVIATNDLNHHLSRPFPTPPAPLRSTRGVGRPPVFATPAHDADWLALVARNEMRPNGGILIHVEGGVKIHDLLDDLASAGLALPTMGAGGGQAVAGALATGTHGSDIDLQTLADAVRAVHLVGPGGQEWWIEPNAGAGALVLHGGLPGWCPDTRVVRDTDFLRSVAVGVGRFGVIYSMVLEVLPQYRLEQKCHETTWDEARTALLSAVSSGYTAGGAVFSDPSPAGSPLRFWQVVVDPASGSRAWVTRRWLTTATPDVGLEKDAFAIGIGFLCTHDEAAVALVWTATATATVVLIQAATGTWTTASLIPFGFLFAPVVVWPFIALTEDLLDAAANFTTLGSWIATVLGAVKNRFGDGPIKTLVDEMIRGVSGAILAGQHPDLRRGPSHRILDTHDYNLDGCLSVDSAEFFFDANSSNYIDFVDGVLDKAAQLGPIVGVVALRFMRRTGTALGMQQFPLTVSIEIAAPRPGEMNQRYMAAAHKLALSLGGIPHWGQEHSLDEEHVEGMYGSQLEPWRWSVAETEASRAKTFSSPFTRERGLEATGPKNSLSQLRARRYMGVSASGG